MKAGTATVGNQEATKADGTKETGNYVTGLDNKTWDADNIVTGRAATEDQLKDALLTNPMQALNSMLTLVVLRLIN